MSGRKRGGIGRILVGAAAAVVVIAMAPLSSATAQAGEPTSGAGAGQTAHGLATSGPVSVMLELDTPPAASAYNANRRFGARAASRASKAQTVRVEALQASVRSQLRRPATAATVIYQTSRVYSGIAVKTDASRLTALAQIPGVKAVHRLVAKSRSNFSTIPLIGAPESWTATGQTGQGVTIGIIDTGIDYSHVDFGGDGNYAAARAAKDAGTAAVGFPSAKVAGGTDFAGNAYTGDNTPVPDSNPLDCEGHGTHVAGTAAGLGVTSGGTTFTGPWDSSTPFASLRIGPGVAPQATLYALKVFGCDGNTALVAEALDWAVDPNNDGDVSDHLNVVNMSLGTDFGSPDDPDSVASNNAESVGVTLAVSMGNNGDLYETGGSPGNASKVIGVAASVDDREIVDSITVSDNSAPAVGYPALFSSAYDWATLPGVTDAAVVRLGDWAAAPGPGNNTDGCDPLSSAEAAAVSGKVVLLSWDDNDATRRCGSAARSGDVSDAGGIGAILGSPAGYFAAGITGSSTIPVVLTRADGTAQMVAALDAGHDVTTTMTNAGSNTWNTPITPNPTDEIVDFSSRGISLPGNVKPDVTAPGTTIFSAKVATGDEGISESGTSMAAPHVAGLAALMVQAHPTWTAEEIKAGMMNTSGHDLFLGPLKTPPTYDALRAGAGRISAQDAVATQAVAYVVDDPGAVSVSFGVLDVAAPQTFTKHVRIADKRSSGSALAYDAAVSVDAAHVISGASYSVSPSSVTLNPGESATVAVTLTVDPSQLLHQADPTISLEQIGPGSPMRDFYTDTSGLLLVTPAGGRALRVPVSAAPRPASSITGGTVVAVNGPGSAVTGTLTLHGGGVNNSSGPAYQSQTSQVSALQLSAISPALPPCTVGGPSICVPTADARSADIHYVGFTSDAGHYANPLSPASDALAYFGIAAWAPWRTASDISEFDVYLDTNNDGTPDAIVYNTRVSSSDVFVSQTISQRSGEEGTPVSASLLNNVAGDNDTAKLHSTVMTLPVRLADLANPPGGLAPFITGTSAPISYWVKSWSAAVGNLDNVGSDKAPLRADLLHPALTAFSATGVLPSRALTGDTLTVKANLSLTGTNPRLLLLNHLNTLGAKAQIVSVRKYVPPAPPTTVTGTAGNRQVVVAWRAPTNPGFSPVTRYTVTASPGARTCTATPPALTCTVTGLTNGTAYTFRVTATNSVGTSASSAPSPAVSPQASPQSQRAGSIPAALRNPGVTVVNPAGAVTVQGQPLTATVSLVGVWRNGDQICRRVITGANRQVSVLITGQCAMRVRVTYTAPGSATLLPYSHAVTYTLAKTR